MSIDVAVIPAAGRGTRMRPATRVVPKALLTVVDRPAIQYAVEEAARAGAKEAVVVVDLDVGHLVAQHFSLEGPLPGPGGRSRFDRWSRRSHLGLGHAVNEAADMVGRPAFLLLSWPTTSSAPVEMSSQSWLRGSGDGSVSVVCLRELERRVPLQLRRGGPHLAGGGRAI